MRSGHDRRDGTGVRLGKSVDQQRFKESKGHAPVHRPASCERHEQGVRSPCRPFDSLGGALDLVQALLQKSDALIVDWRSRFRGAGLSDGALRRRGRDRCRSDAEKASCLLVTG